ncbi:MAG: AI-2E family transporter [Clostridia bacterium]|nr:AI-2E family transporter [Clostridia bacterium]
MDFSKKNIKTILGLISFAIVVFTISQNLSVVAIVWAKLLKILAPVIVGFCLAFILNIPMTIIEKKLLSPMSKSNKKIVNKFVRPISLLLTIVLSLGFIALMLFAIIPQLKNSFELIAERVPQYYKSIVLFVEKLITKFNIDFDTSMLHNPSVNIDKFVAMADKYLTFENTNSIVNTTFSFTSSLVSGFTNILLGLIVSIYMLAEKEKILSFAKKFFHALLPEKAFDKGCEICNITSTSFSSFIGGQFTDAFVLAILCFIGMSIFRFPNAAVISVIIGVTALIPVIGPLIGEFVGCFIIFMESPIKALFFLVFVLILQAIDNNFIYPKIVGKSVGLPGIIVLIAVIIGGNLGGIMGILLGVPTASAIYAIITKWLNSKKENITVAEENDDEQATVSEQIIP